MPDIIVDLPDPRCYSRFSGPGIEEYQSLDPDPFLSRARDARGRFARGSSGNPASPSTRGAVYTSFSMYHFCCNMSILEVRRDEAEGQATKKDEMRVRMDEMADALYIRLEEAAIVDSEEISPGVVLDFDDNGRVVGIEMLNVPQKLPGADLKRVPFEVA